MTTKATASTANDQSDQTKEANPIWDCLAMTAAGIVVMIIWTLLK